MTLQDLLRTKLHILRRAIRAIILALDILHNLLHLLGLPRPLLSGHLRLPAEQRLVGPAVAAAQAVPQRGILAVVIVEVQVVHGVAGGAVEDRAVGGVLAVVDQHGPDLHEDEEAQVGELLQREDEGEDVVGERLHPAVDGVEGDGGVGRGHDPFVVSFVQVLVDARQVEAAVDEVDAEISEKQEDGELQPVVVGPGLVGQRVVELGVAADLGEEEGDRQDRDEGHGVGGLFDLHLDLVFEELGVLERCLVEDEEVGEGGYYEVYRGAGEPGTD